MIVCTFIFCLDECIDLSILIFFCYFYLRSFLSGSSSVLAFPHIVLDWTILRTVKGVQALESSGIVYFDPEKLVSLMLSMLFVTVKERRTQFCYFFFIFSKCTLWKSTMHFIWFWINYYNCLLFFAITTHTHTLSPRDFNTSMTMTIQSQ